MSDDASLLHTTTDLLAATSKLLPFNLLLAAVTAWRADEPVSVSGWVVLLLASIYWHWRIALDAAIFRRWADGAVDMLGFDAALFMLFGRRKQANAPLVMRCRGAVRLCWQLLLLTVVQVVVAAVLLC